MPALPLALVAFATGTVLLQWQPTLPQAGIWLAAAALLALTGALVRIRATPATAMPIVVGILTVAAAGAFGFGYAAWRADVRLAEA